MQHRCSTADRRQAAARGAHQVCCGGRHQLHRNHELGGAGHEGGAVVGGDGGAVALLQHRNLALDLVNVLLSAGRKAGKKHGWGGAAERAARQQPRGAVAGRRVSGWRVGSGAAARLLSSPLNTHMSSRSINLMATSRSATVSYLQCTQQQEQEQAAEQRRTATAATCARRRCCRQCAPVCAGHQGTLTRGTRCQRSPCQ